MEDTEVISVPETTVISAPEIKAHLEKERAKALSKERFSHHNWEGHIVPGYEDAGKLGKLAGLPQKDIGLLQIAWLYHEIGLPEGREGHEEKSAEIAGQELKDFGFPEEEIKTVKEIIIGTKGKMEDVVYVTEPSDNLLVNIMRDVDFANVGKVNFPELSDNLRQEMGVEDKDKWREFQVEVLTKHKFYTKEAEDLWGEQKRKNLANLKKV